LKRKGAQHYAAKNLKITVIRLLHTLESTAKKYIKYLLKITCIQNNIIKKVKIPCSKTKTDILDYLN